MLPDEWKSEISRAVTNGVKDVKLKVPSMAPDDPDRILYTRTAQDLALLLSVDPGDPVPPFPFGFMMEDAAIESAVANGEKVIEVDNGNKQFLDSLKKWSIAVKDGDSEQQIAYKQMLVDGQLELMKGIEEGDNVNSMIRAAYEFRKEAFETRMQLLRFVTEESRNEDGSQNVELAEKQLELVNEKLSESGIRKIGKDEVIEGYEEPEDGQEGEVK